MMMMVMQRGIRPSDLINVLPEFDPSSTTSLTSTPWIKRVTDIKNSYQVPDKMIIITVASKMKTSSRLWYDGTHHSFTNWELFCTDFKSCFPSMANDSNVHVKLMTRTRSINESIDNYFYEMLAIGRSSNVTDDAIIRYIITGLNNSALINALSTRVFTNVYSLLEAIKMFNGINEQHRIRGELLKPNKVSHGNDDVQIISSDEASETSTQKFFPKCYNCNEMGHLSRDCPKPPKRPRCAKCGKSGHEAEECKLSSGNVRFVRAIVDEFHKIVKVNGNRMLAYIDFGSNCVTIRKSECEALQLKVKTVNGRLYGFGSGICKPIGTVNIQVEIDTVKESTSAFVVPDSAQEVGLMIGHNVFDKPNIKVSKSFKELKIEYDLNVTRQHENLETECVVNETVAKINRITYTLDSPNDINIESNDNKLCQRIYEVINENRYCVAQNLHELGTSSLAEVSLDLTSNEPIRQPSKIAQRNETKNL